jgi:hypothetical protein
MQHRPQRSTVEMYRSTGTACGVPGSTTHPRGRVGSRTAQYTVWSTLLFDVANRYDHRPGGDLHP